MLYCSDIPNINLYKSPFYELMIFHLIASIFILCCLKCKNEDIVRATKLCIPRVLYEHKSYFYITGRLTLYKLLFQVSEMHIMSTVYKVSIKVDSTEESGFYCCIIVIECRSICFHFICTFLLCLCLYDLCTLFVYIPCICLQSFGGKIEH